MILLFYTVWVVFFDAASGITCGFWAFAPGKRAVSADIHQWDTSTNLATAGWWLWLNHNSRHRLPMEIGDTVGAWEVSWLGVAESPTSEILNWLGKGYERMVEWCSMGDVHWFSICNGARWDIQLVSWQVMFFCSTRYTDVHFGYMKKYVLSHWIWT